MNGAGIRDLQDIYCQEAATALRNALTNEGRLGRLTRQLYVAHWNACKSGTGSTLDNMLLRSRSNKSLICRRLAMLIPRGMLPPSHTPTLVSLRAHQWIEEVPAHARAAAPGNVSTAPPPTTKRPRETSAQTAHKKVKEANTMYCPSTALNEHESYTSVNISEKRVYKGKNCPDGQVQFLCKWPAVLLEKEFAMQHLGASKPFYRYRDGGSAQTNGQLAEHVNAAGKAFCLVELKEHWCAFSEAMIERHQTTISDLENGRSSREASERQSPTPIAAHLDGLVALGSASSIEQRRVDQQARMLRQTQRAPQTPRAPPAQPSGCPSRPWPVHLPRVNVTQHETNRT